MLPMESIRSDLRQLIAKYGLPAVYNELQIEMREIFQFARQVYEPPRNNLVIPVSNTIPDRIATPLHKPIPSAFDMIMPTQLNLSEADSDTESENDTCLIQADHQEVIPQAIDQSLKQVIIQAKSEMKQTEEKFSKAKHKEQVKQKHKELTEKGIKPESLLTKENLTKWLGEGMSYMRIARELTGVPDNEIAAIAKTFGLQSDVKKYVVMKRGKK